MVDTRKIAGATGTLFLMFSFYLAYCGWRCPIKEGNWPGVKILQLVVLVIWSLAPPIWFWYDYFFRYRIERGWKPNGDAPKDFEIFKYEQAVSSRNMDCRFVRLVCSLFR
jgi:hypothetical protein